ncbi:class II glutamine amidotransferase [Granulosicoccus antarcticus]|uniref:Amidophosphoribosyltransferase n=1 Tax=Granulosicoccus antarcticus IMCC3135 TaxID=1192854 RepID=A0A2Z2P086_9GAMM|nr:glutamine amidotransferase family protein [Granulosicoccus antarcticus]ASJ75661.1 Amidophosphoribosyltransferase [Granulosicoccus antarcticus IMCC3135]
MCGIVGLYLKNEALYPQLGALFKPMLISMTSRGPDSAGVAIYRNPVAEGQVKFSLAHERSDHDWNSLSTALAEALACANTIVQRDTHAILVTDGDERSVQSWLAEHAPDVRVVGRGSSVEIFKETGLPEQVYDRFDLASAQGRHMIGHTRMATESAVTTAGSHPFATGADLCLVHNGSLSNHNRLREELKRRGVSFSTENDSEVAAAYLTAKLQQGISLKDALEQALDDLDGFYTFCIGTGNGFAVLRDPIACKHAILAETDDWVAMATEYRAIATLPGAENARTWEPRPATVYAWGAETLEGLSVNDENHMTAGVA